MTEKIPEWFRLTDEANGLIMGAVANALKDNGLPVSLRNYPEMAHWFMLDSLLFANQANRDGMHANALAITRQCLETISIIELGLSKSVGREEILERWWNNKITPGKIRQWLAGNVWPGYGSGLWNEPWEDFMAKLSNAVQPYAHYTGQLAQWQMALQFADRDSRQAYVKIGPRAYDAQKATRITLFHGILAYALGRIVIASSDESQPEFSALVNRLGRALGNSRYLDGHKTDWDQQFWAMVWDRNTGSSILE